MALNFIFDDYETFGKEVFGASSQWAAVTTDEKFNIKDTHNIFCKISQDVVPDPVACLITKVTPQKTIEHGLEEYEFAHRINDILSKNWETVVVGYNSVNFDDEVTRFLNYRNLIDPYKWAYDKKRSRFDALPLVRLIHALKPDAFNWPEVSSTDENGNETTRVSFKLENLSDANGIVHECKHDALSDVYALIGIMKQAREKAPEIFDMFFKMRSKWAAKDLLENNEVLGLCNFRFVKTNYISPVRVLGVSASSQNKYWTWNLQVDPTPFASMSPEELETAIKMKKDERELTGTPRSGMVSVKTNEVPCIFDPTLLKGAPLERAGLQDIRDSMHQNSEFLKSNPEFVARLIEVYENRKFEDKEVDTDTNLYDQKTGGFFSDAENKLISDFRAASSWSEKLDTVKAFPEGRVKEMAFRIIGRNSPDTFQDVESKSKWVKYVNARLAGKTANAFTSIQSLEEQLSGQEVAELISGDEVNQQVHVELQAYLEDLKLRFENNEHYLNSIQ